MIRSRSRAAVVAAHISCLAVSCTGPAEIGEPVGTSRSALSQSLVISQIYGGGGNNGATYTQDFIEIFNRGGAPVPLAGLSVQYAGATGNFQASGTTALPAVTLGAGQYLLIAIGTPGSNGAALPAPDASNTAFNLAAPAGKVALAVGIAPLPCASGVCVITSTAVIDFVGYGAANQFEGADPAPGPAAGGINVNARSVQRKGGGCVETDQNRADFEVPERAPVARNRGSALNVCPGIGLDGGALDVGGVGDAGDVGTSTGALDAAIADVGTGTGALDAAVLDGALADVGTGTGALDAALLDGALSDAGAGTGGLDGAVLDGALADAGTSTGAGDAAISDAGTSTGAGDASVADAPISDAPVSDAAGGDAGIAGDTGVGADAAAALDSGADGGVARDASNAPGRLVISQIYGGGGNGGATYRNDFVELFNRGDAPVALEGLSVQYASSTGNFNAPNVTALPNAVVEPGRYFLLELASNGLDGVALPAADASNISVNLAAGSGKVALVEGTTALGSQLPCDAGTCAPSLIDFVGYGSNASHSEGSGPAPGVGNNTASVQRRFRGCIDTDDNAADFERPPLLADARNSATAAFDCNQPPPDAGPPADSGARDSGVRDSGMRDSGVRDSGARDALVRDLGTSIDSGEGGGDAEPAPDAASPGDAAPRDVGTSPPPEDEGCSCAAARGSGPEAPSVPGSAVLIAALALLCGSRRLRVRARRPYGGSRPFVIGGLNAE